MALSVGEKLGPYEILAPIGAGGMGEVYKARDTRLDRIVAIKVSMTEFSERFEREARAIASLNHSHICQLYDVGPNYLVMEFVDGAPITAPDSPRKLLDFAVQIAEGMAAAHAVPLVHRDLKPDNILVTSAQSAHPGRVKILDFGLAKTGAEASGKENATRTIGLTDAGTLIGTIAYMSPEQARGVTSLTAQSDQFSFGLVLYELAAGKRAFARGSAVETMTAIIREDAEPLPASVPAPLRWVIERLLAKDPTDRYDSTRDLYRELKQIRERYSEATSAQPMEIDNSTRVPEIAPMPAVAPSRRRLSWLFTTLAILAALGAGAFWQSLRTPAEVQWTASLLGGPTNSRNPRLSPDGQLLAFIAFIDELPQLGVMKPDGASWTMLTSVRDSGYVTTISWSPDSSKIYFDRYWGQPRGIFSVPPLGGEPRMLLDDAFNPESLPDGSLIVAKLTDQGDHQLFHFWPESGKLEPLPAFITPSDAGTPLRASPDGKEVVYFGTGGPETRSQSPNIYVFDLTSRMSRRLLPSAEVSGPMTLAPDGRLAYATAAVGDLKQIVTVPRQGSGPRRVLMSFPSTAGPISIDVARDGAMYVDQQPTLQSGVRFTEGGSAAFSGEGPVVWLSNGDLAFAPKQGGKSHLMVQHAGAQPHMLLQTTEESSGPAAPVPGGMIAFVLGSGEERQIALAQVSDGRVTRRFGPAAAVSSIAATPDASQLFYSSGGHIWAQPIAGGEPRQITAGTDAAVDATGQFLYVKRNEKGIIKLFRTSLAGSDAQELLMPSEYHLAIPALSPSAIDSKGRILLTVISAHSYYYHAAIFDPRTKDLRLPLDFDGDVSAPAWLPDGRIGAAAQRYTSSLWRYRQVK
jgi:serine/threonine protein kinase